MTQTRAGKNIYLETFESARKNGHSKDPSWLRAIRETAFGHFSRLGFPTTHDENWKYTNVNPIAEISFKRDAKKAFREPSLAEIEPFFLAKSRLVFINGLYSKELSSAQNCSSGVHVSSLKEAFQSNSKVIERYLNQIIPADQNGFTALNAAFIEDGAFVFLDEKTVLAEPLQLLFVSSGEGDFLSQPRNLIVAGKQSKATILESYVSVTSARYFTNAVTELVLEEGASVDYLKLQLESEAAFHIGATQVKAEASSTFSSFSLSTGAKIGRNGLNVILNAEGAQCELNGLSLSAQDQLMDNTTLIDHLKPCGTSRQLYKGLLGGNSTAVFFGKIFVHQDAQKTDAQQTNKNLLLSDGATMDARPQLEIFADDVKCTHGAAIGQLEEDSLFYLQTRGIGLEAARKLLSYGFANEVVLKIKIPSIRESIARMVMSRLETLFPKEVSHASS